jgi:hypothetical protein
MIAEKHYKWFCRISETNIIKNDNSIYKYNFKEIYNFLSEKYDKVMYIVHNKDIDNIHAHFIIQNASQIRKNTLLKIMPYGSCDIQMGSNLECYNYLLHKDIENKESYNESDIITNLNSDNLKKWLNQSKDESENYNDFILDIYNNMSDIELSKKYPKYYFRYSNKLDKIRETIQHEKSNYFRDVEVYYIYGESRTGKTYNVISSCKEKDLSYYRVTDYQRDPFYGYNGEEVMIFDEYHSDIPLNCFLTYLEGYERTQLPSRYRNRFALYTKVYIISNVSLDKQYEYADYETKKALHNRIKTITFFTREYIITTTINGNTISKVNNPLYEESLSLPF